MILRDYQQRCVDEVRSAFQAGHRRVLLGAPTGAGKTVIFSYISKNAALRGNRVCILVHRQELVDQTSRALYEFEVPHGIIAAGVKPASGALVQVASVQTLVRRLDRLAPPDLIVVDEAHHSVAGTWLQVLAAFPEARILGVTATPERLDGKGLSDLYDIMVHGPSVAELIERGFLCRPVYWSKPNIYADQKLHKSGGDYVASELDAKLTNAVMGDAIYEYQRHSDGLPAIAFLPTITKAEELAEQFRSEGYRFETIHGKLKKDQRRHLVNQLATGELQGLTSCNIVSEGFDLPVITTAILLRKTASLGLHLQQIGRVLRPHSSKTRSIIIDHVGNLYAHGRAEDDRQWTLDGRPKGAGAAPLKQCPQCLVTIPAGCQTCPECDHSFEVESESGGESEKRIDGELVEFNQGVPELADCRTMGDFERYGRARGYKRGWAWHRFQAMQKRISFRYQLT